MRLRRPLTIKRVSCIFILIFYLSACGVSTETKSPVSVFSDKVICLDPGHGGTAATDSYRAGPAGEREEWINLRVALLLRDTLEARGAMVLMTRTADVTVPLEERARLAVDNKADVFLSIHHNATADSSVNFPIIYYHANASENQASVWLARQVGKHLLENMYGNDSLLSIVSDHTIFPKAGTSVLRHTYGIPGVIGEASFFTNPAEEQRLKEKSYNQQEAQAYLEALQAFFSQPHPPVKEKYSRVQIPPFAVLQEAERMRPEALLWLEDYEKGHALFTRHLLDSAYRLLTRSARHFPDSYVAGEAHRLRAEILKQKDSTALAATTFLRVTEYYVHGIKDTAQGKTASQDHE